MKPEPERAAMVAGRTEAIVEELMEALRFDRSDHRSPSRGR